MKARKAHAASCTHWRCYDWVDRAEQIKGGVGGGALSAASQRTAMWARPILNSCSTSHIGIDELSAGSDRTLRCFTGVGSCTPVTRSELWQ